MIKLRANAHQSHVCRESWIPCQRAAQLHVSPQYHFENVLKLEPGCVQLANQRWLSMHKMPSGPGMQLKLRCEELQDSTLSLMEQVMVFFLIINYFTPWLKFNSGAVLSTQRNDRQESQHFRAQVGAFVHWGCHYAAIYSMQCIDYVCSLHPSIHSATCGRPHVNLADSKHTFYVQLALTFPLSCKESISNREMSAAEWQERRWQQHGINSRTI